MHAEVEEAVAAMVVAGTPVGMQAEKVIRMHTSAKARRIALAIRKKHRT